MVLLLGFCDDCLIKVFWIKIIKVINNNIIIIFKVIWFILRLLKFWFLMLLILDFGLSLFCLLLEKLFKLKLGEEFNFKLNFWF